MNVPYAAIAAANALDVDEQLVLDTLSAEPVLSATSTFTTEQSVSVDLSHIAPRGVVTVRTAAMPRLSGRRLRRLIDELGRTEIHALEQVLHVRIVRRAIANPEDAARVRECLTDLPVILIDTRVDLARFRQPAQLDAVEGLVRDAPAELEPEEIPVPEVDQGLLPLPAAPADPADALERARQRRDAILATGQWRTSTEVEELARGAGEGLVTNPAQYASRLRAEKRLFGVRRGREYLHPDFQFVAATGLVHTALPRLLAQLPDEDHGWAAAFWLYQPSHALDGRTPAETFRADPERAIAYAETIFGSGDAAW